MGGRPRRPRQRLRRRLHWPTPSTSSASYRHWRLRRPATVRTPSPPRSASPAAASDPVEVVWQSTGGPETLRFPDDGTLDPHGNLWVADSVNDCFHICLISASVVGHRRRRWTHTRTDPAPRPSTISNGDVSTPTLMPSPCRDRTRRRDVQVRRPRAAGGWAHQDVGDLTQVSERTTPNLGRVAI